MIKKIALSSFLALTLLGGDIENEFLLSLNEASEIVAKEKINIDKIPSSVTVLRSDFIQKSGAKTLFELLDFIPGIATSMSASGKREIIIRGDRQKYRDKFKLLIDGVDVTNNLYSNQFYYYNFPTALIKRIEVTKTPDAITYGSNSLLGVVNVITKKEVKNLSIFVDSQRENITSFNQFFSIFGGKATIDGYNLFSKPTIKSDPTLLIDLQKHSATPFRFSTSAHTLEKNRGLGLSWQKDDFWLRYRYEYYKKGNFFGIVNLPPLQKDRFVNLTHQFIQIAKEGNINPKLFWHLEANYKDYIWNGEFRAYPYDFNPKSKANKDIIFGAYIHEKEESLLGYLKYKGFIHDITFQIETKYAKPAKSYYLQHLK